MKKPINIKDINVKQVSEKVAKENNLKIHKGIAFDDNGNKIDIASVNEVEFISPTKMRLPSGTVLCMDTNEQSVELYNPNDKPVYLVNEHKNEIERLKFFQKIVVPPKAHCFLPHKYFRASIGYIGCTDKFNMILNYGDARFKGNTKPSPISVKKIMK
jgi:hypothetical protein